MLVLNANLLYSSQVVEIEINGTDFNEIEMAWYLKSKETRIEMVCKIHHCGCQPRYFNIYKAS